MMTSIWFHNVIAYGLQATLVVGGGALLAYLLRMRTPAAKLAYLQSLLLICLLLPLVEPWRAREYQSPVAITGRSPQLAAARVYRSDTPPPRPFPVADAVLLILAGGTAVRFLWLALGCWSLRRYRAASSGSDRVAGAVRAAQQRLGIRAIFSISDKIAGPITFGLRHPLILLPASFLDMEPWAQEAIACHELIHVRRRDWLFTVLEELVLTVFWFHPALWWLTQQIRLAREQVVDREVIHITNARDQYLETLVAVARLTKSLRPAPATLFLRRRYLVERVAAVLTESSMSKRRLISCLLTGLCAVLLIARMSVMLFPLQGRAQEPSPKAGQRVEPVTIERGDEGLLHRPLIVYPRRAIEQRVEGSVVLEINIDDRGLVSDARVLSGPDQLRRATL